MGDDLDQERLPVGAGSFGREGMVERKGAPGLEGATNLDSPRKGQSPSRRHVYAALDLGTNNCRLLVARRPAAGALVGGQPAAVVCLNRTATHS